MFLRKQKSHPPSQPKKITSDCSHRLSDLSWKTVRNGKSPSFLVNTFKISRQRPFPTPQPTKKIALFSTQKFADWHPTYFAYDVAETSASAIASPATKTRHQTPPQLEVVSAFKKICKPSAHRVFSACFCCARRMSNSMQIRKR